MQWHLNETARVTRPISNGRHSMKHKELAAKSGMKWDALGIIQSQTGSVLLREWGTHISLIKFQITSGCVNQAIIAFYVMVVYS